MKLKGLDDKYHNVNIGQNTYPMKSEDACKSKIQYRCGQLIKSRFPGEVILEEFSIPGGRLYLDFFLPRLKLAFEIHGEQHDTFNGFFHGNIQGFHKSKTRDSNKSYWCKVNGIRLYEIRTEDELQGLLGLKDEE